MRHFIVEPALALLPGDGLQSNFGEKIIPRLI
jgi:hypothetical protein